MLKAVIAGLAIFASIGCTTPSQPIPGGGVSPTIQVQADRQFDLMAYQEAVVEGTSLRIRFNAVSSESRCPSDVQCVWAGNAIVSLSLASSGIASGSATLNTTLDPKFTDYAGYRITLLGLKPYPKSGSKIPAADYVATLEVRKL
jgi:hypothetical protein